MAYLYSRQPTRRARVGHIPPRARVRIENGGTQLGVLPLVAAAVPSVSDLAKKALSSLVGIVDPGKKRDAARQAQAEQFYQWAVAGSITAARTLHGGTHIPYTSTEKGFYSSRWSSFQTSNPTLASAAVAAGDFAPVDLGQQTTVPPLPSGTQTQIQNEINAAHGKGTAAVIPSTAGLANIPYITTVTAPAGSGGDGTSTAGPSGSAGLLLALGVAGALLKKLV